MSITPLHGAPADPYADARRINPQLEETQMKRYVIEREIPKVGALGASELKNVAATSNSALAKLGGRAQWVQSFVADDKTFCVYLAEDEQAVMEHARISGFPATRVTEVRGVIDPMTDH
jgi:Nickel responsive protein SCO4226-like